MAEKKYIELKKALNVCQMHYQHYLLETDFDKCTVIECVVDDIETIPTADVAEVRHGYWKRNERNIPKMKEFHEKGIALSMSEKSIFYNGSCCGSWGSLSQNYCSNCGARMVGDE